MNIRQQSIRHSLTGRHLGELFDLIPHHADATLVRGIQFEDSLLEEHRAEEVTGQGKDGGGLACAGRPVEEQMGEL